MARPGAQERPPSPDRVLQRKPDNADLCDMDGRAQLHALALAITDAADVDAAWAGTGPAVALRKSCAACGEDQPVRLPFLRHVCRRCAAVWVPGICTICAHTSITFTLDGNLSSFARCGCEGALRPLAVIPRPRVVLPPEQVAERQTVVARRTRWAVRVERSALLLVLAVAVVGAVRVLAPGDPAAPSRPAQVVPTAAVDLAAMTPGERGTYEAERLTRDERGHDLFSCLSVLPAALSALPSDAPERKAFLGNCLKG